jgi:hypothetical protein
VSADTGHTIAGDTVTTAAGPSTATVVPATQVAAVRSQPVRVHAHARQHNAMQAHEHAPVTAQSAAVAHHARPAARSRTETGMAAPMPRPTPATTDGDNVCGGEHGHGDGHDHAPGWQKNWGPNGRHPGHCG